MRHLSSYGVLGALVGTWDTEMNRESLCSLRTLSLVGETGKKIIAIQYDKCDKEGFVRSRKGVAIQWEVGMVT